jgi:outer membrane protein OmpA-like peptidoglycan-associated protein
LAVVALAGLLWTAPAAAQNDGRLAVQLINVVSGEKMPAVVIRPQQDMRKLTIELKRADGEKQTVRSGPVPGGQQKELAVRQPVGSFRYRADFTVDWGGGDTSTFAMTFDMTRAGKLELKVDTENDVDLDARTMTFSITNVAVRATLTLFGASGKVLGEVNKAYNRPRPNTPLSLSWPATSSEILYMDLKVYDFSGFWKGVRLSPLFWDIPHDDPLFDTDRWEIKPSEEPKVRAVLTRINDKMAEQRRLNVQSTPMLYVAGYTDTMGSKPHNQRLSENRARSIAHWFRSKGLRIPIFYQGFGEDGQKVKTPDETDEPRNRRVKYVLTTQRVSKTTREWPRDKWVQLP